MSPPPALPTLVSELRRGAVVLAVLSRLRTPQYGYALRHALAQAAFPVEEGTLYPLLRRLESQGVLASEWRTDDGAARRYYHLTDAGDTLLTSLTASWTELTATMRALLAGES